MCRKNLLPAAFLIGAGVGLLLSLVLGGSVSVLLAIVLIVAGIVLVKG